ncbi:hypothetical protein K1I93_09720, partial [Streptococcus australis]|nr:hypothetical protein [Streptococcus australis]
MIKKEKYKIMKHIYNEKNKERNVHNKINDENDNHNFNKKRSSISYYFDDYFYFFIKLCYDLDLYIQIQRINIFLTDEKYFEFLKIHIMNKSTKNKNVPFYLCNNSVEQNNNLIQVLQKCFKHFNLYNG